jgi:ADP-ribose pyrophosphatase YjhB (NUDIX family)
LPKGKANAGEGTAYAALRGVLEETGHGPEIIGHIPGTFHGGNTASTKLFYLMQRSGKPVDPAAMAANADTTAVRWANIDDTRALISWSTITKVRDGDLATLEAAFVAYDQIWSGFEAKFEIQVEQPFASSEDPEDGWIVLEGEGYPVIAYGAERAEDGEEWFSTPCHICDPEPGSNHSMDCPLGAGRRQAQPDRCRDCGRPAGAIHVKGCGIERCARCGGQYRFCECDGSEDASDADDTAIGDATGPIVT